MTVPAAVRYQRRFRAINTDGRPVCEQRHPGRLGMADRRHTVRYRNPRLSLALKIKKFKQKFQSRGYTPPPGQQRSWGRRLARGKYRFRLCNSDLRAGVFDRERDFLYRPHEDNWVTRFSKHTGFILSFDVRRAQPIATLNAFQSSRVEKCHTDFQISVPRARATHCRTAGARRTRVYKKRGFNGGLTRAGTMYKRVLVIYRCTGYRRGTIGGSGDNGHVPFRFSTFFPSR